MPRFDYDPLAQPVDPAAVARLREESRRAGVEPAESSAFALLLISIVGAVVALGMMTVVWLAHLTFRGPAGLIQILFFVILGIITIYLLLVGIPGGIRLLRSQWVDFSRARSFASANVLTYTAAEDGRDLDGALFQMNGASRHRAGSVFRSRAAPEFEIVGHYHYAKDQQEVHWGYLAVDLRRPLPHLVLRSRRRRLSHRRFLTRYSNGPALSLHGDGARQFTLYGTADTAAEAGTVFTPELVARLARLGPGIDAETLGTHLFVYSSKPFRVPRPRVVKALFDVIDAVLAAEGDRFP